MTSFVRTLFDNVRRQLRRDDGDGADLAPVLSVRVPAAVPDEVAAAVAERIATLARRRAGELGLPGAVTEDLIRGPDGEPAAVFLRGRPVAVAPVPAERSDPRWVDEVTGTVDRALVRRLSLLLDEQAMTRWRGRAAPDPAGRQLGALGYLLDNGVSVARVEPAQVAAAASGVAGGQELGEVLIDTEAPTEVVVEVAEATLRRANGPRPDDLVDAREALFEATGLQFPDVRLVPTDERAGTLRIRLNDVTLPHPLDPAADWADVVRAVQAELLAHASWFVRLSDLQRSLDQLGDYIPDLVELVGRCYPRPLLAACVRAVLRHGESARNLPRILWLLLEVGVEEPLDRLDLSYQPLLPTPGEWRPVPSEPDLLVAGLRRRVSDESPTGTAYGPAAGDVRLSGEAEDAVVAAADPEALALAERQVLAEVPITDRPLRVVVRSTAALARVRAVLLALPAPPQVVSLHELGLAAVAAEVRRSGPGA